MSHGKRIENDNIILEREREREREESGERREERGERRVERGCVLCLG